MISTSILSTLVAALTLAPADASPPADATPAVAPEGVPEGAPASESEGPSSTEGPPAEGAPSDDASADDSTPSEGASEGDDASDESPAGPEGGARLPPPALPALPPTQAAPVKQEPPPRPIRWRLDFGLGFGSTLVSDRGYRAFNDRRHLPEVSTSAIFDFRLAEGRFFLGGGLAYQRLGRDDGSAHGQLGTELTLHEPEVLGRLSVMTIEGIDVFARFGAGPSIVDLDFYSTETANQRAVIPRVDGQAGVSLYLPKPWLARKRASRVTAGFDLGLGYTWRGKIAVQPDLHQGDDPLRATTSPWGDLSLQGLSWRVGLFIRVM